MTHYSRSRFGYIFTRNLNLIEFKSYHVIQKKKRHCTECPFISQTYHRRNVQVDLGEPVRNAPYRPAIESHSIRTEKQQYYPKPGVVLTHDRLKTTLSKMFHTLKRINIKTYHNYQSTTRAHNFLRVVAT